MSPSATSAILACSLCLSSLAQAQAPVARLACNRSQGQGMLAKLTLAEKIELIGGVDDMFTNAMPSIDLPRFKMSDASVGVRTWGPTTAYAGGVALAATWDPRFRPQARRRPGHAMPAPAASTSCSAPASTSPARLSAAATSNISLKIPISTPPSWFPTSRACSRRA